MESNQLWLTVNNGEAISKLGLAEDEEFAENEADSEWQGRKGVGDDGRGLYGEAEIIGEPGWWRGGDESNKSNEREVFLGF